jgi:uncharacterized protein YbjQ (UPF0145 family)
VPETEVRFYPNPWVSGTRAAAYFGPIAVRQQMEAFNSETFEKTIQEGLMELGRKCVDLGANAVVGMELSVHPWEAPPHVLLVGTAAKLEKL